MNKKERILDLMRRGVISNEEAIELLENLENKNKEVNTAGTEDIFSGFDPSTFFDGADFDKINDEYSSKSEEDKKKIEKEAADFADTLGEAFKGFVGWGNELFDNVKSKVDDNFEWKGGTFKVKTTKKSESRTIDKDIRAINIASQTGDVEIVKSSDDKVKIDFDFEVFGVDDPEKFIEENVTVTDDAGILDINIPSKRISADMVISLPAKRYDSLTINTINGEVSISSSIIDYVRVSTINGDLDTDDLSSSIAELTTKNGDLKVTDGNFTDLKASTINGDIRVNADFETSDISSVNGAIRMTPTLKAKKVTAKNVNGDIKMSVPSKAGITGLAKTSFGNYKTRLELDNPVDIGKSGVALVRKGDDVITFDIESKMGSIWLKDAE
ncbi:hypothetical protein BG262_05445 [Floricoccus penangensis]|uniref:DUF4097 domain-containing protein n=1 Tax=Floricoccus penangensis TaxID=1859475 RepID=A0A9Q5P0L3_9LACT|nr:DUF4097 family beta strand repeat-containing protein [Floricoccus penangensis]OFI46460.1 hypothetical protein BG262_05445 [Floricoccus penangensis]